MSELLDKAVEAVRLMPPGEQDTIAMAMLAMARSNPASEIDPDHLRDVIEWLEEINRGEIATDAEVEAAFSRFAP